MGRLWPRGVGSCQWDGHVQRVEVHCEDLLGGLWGLCKQSAPEKTFFSVDVIFFLRINDMNDAFLEEETVDSVTGFQPKA